MIGLIDYGSGNIYAIANVYKRLDIPFVITKELDVLRTVNKLILPGVGAFDETMQMLQESGLKKGLDELVLENKVPILGVCVGMQIMGRNSEEGQLEGFGWIDALVKKFDPAQLKHKPHLPHLGWNRASTTQEHPLFQNVNPRRGFYFLHSYYMVCKNQSDVLATTDYGINYASAVNHQNVYGAQFHPEKSHSNGIEFFRNFANL